MLADIQRCGSKLDRFRFSEHLSSEREAQSVHQKSEVEYVNYVTDLRTYDSVLRVSSWVKTQYVYSGQSSREA